ncbi:hypothetical protein M3Y97_00563100 [Aphelenchoides bicaudatus]|nr:hypothetical protein M3Y97_00563100 [Aphelenchoides bicaudatus]
MVNKMSMKYQMARKYEVHAANSMEIPKILRSVEICLNNYKHIRQKISEEYTPSTSTHSANAFQEAMYSDDDAEDTEVDDVQQNTQNVLDEQSTHEDEDWHVFMKPGEKKYISTKQMDPHIAREHPILFPHLKTKEPPIQRFNLDIEFEPGGVVAINLTLTSGFLTTAYFGAQYYVYMDQRAPRAEWSQQIKCMSAQKQKLIFKGQIRIESDRFLPGQRIVFLTLTGYVGFQKSGFSLPFVIYIDSQQNYECNYSVMKEQANQLQ